MFSVLKWFGTYSAIHQAARLPAAGRNGLQRAFLPVAPIHSQWKFFHPKGIVPVKAMEQPGAVRPANWWITLLLLAKLLATRMVSEEHSGFQSPIHNPWTFFRSIRMVPVKARKPAAWWIMLLEIVWFSPVQTETIYSTIHKTTSLTFSCHPLGFTGTIPSFH